MIRTDYRKQKTQHTSRRRTVMYKDTQLTLVVHALTMTSENVV